MKIGCEPGIECANVLDPQDDNLFAFVLIEAQCFVTRALWYRDGLGAFCGGLWAEGQPILFDTRQGAKKKAMTHVPGIVRHAEDEQIFRVVRVRVECADAVLRPEIA